ncbi:hypothetical protein PIB30_081863 [Stylosanthes scabra]|uniref:Uncharacterized protein n=1 Tax=Stylosanthes scabra TaxID=79078 RepID=A0ABU6UQN7_9FABA|nr:hypothetical protein [Stylosanthes scabra]
MVGEGAVLHLGETFKIVKGPNHLDFNLLASLRNSSNSLNCRTRFYALALWSILRNFRAQYALHSNSRGLQELLQVLVAKVGSPSLIKVLGTPNLQKMKNEERKLAEQETKFGSKTEEELHAYAWKSTHMHATQGPLHA